MLKQIIELVLMDRLIEQNAGLAARNQQLQLEQQFVPFLKSDDWKARPVA
jgi:hypothetical protein